MQKIVKKYINMARMQDNRERFYTLSRDELDSKFPRQYLSNMIWIISNDFRNLQHEKILGPAMGVLVRMWIQWVRWTWGKGTQEWLSGDQ